MVLCLVGGIHIRVCAGGEMGVSRERVKMSDGQQPSNQATKQDIHDGDEEFTQICSLGMAD